MAPDSRYVPALDGVRAVAVLLVVGFHFKLSIAGTQPFRSGLFGVDIFFVLSGYLITSLLLDEQRRNDAISLGRFWMRRALRLLPMVAVLLLIGAAVYASWPSTNSQRPQPLAFVAVATYWTNWLKIWRPDDAGMLSHAWSLAIEEQFYLVWPLVVIATLRWWPARARARVALGVLAGSGAVLVAVNRAYTWMQRPAALPANAAPLYRYVYSRQIDDAYRRWYYGSFTRTSGLLFGALLAVVLSQGKVRDVLTRRSRVLAATGLAGVMVVAAIVVADMRAPLQSFVPYWGLAALEVAVAGVVVWLVLVPTGLGQVVFAHPALVWIGRRSYGIYILHVPVLLFLARLAVPQPKWVAIPASLVAAGVSYRWIELPALRMKQRFASA